MTQIARCDWLPGWAWWSHLVCSGLPSVSRKKNLPESHIINQAHHFLLNKSFIGQVCSVKMAGYQPRSLLVSFHKHAKKELGQCPSILTSHLVNNPYVIHGLWTRTNPIVCSCFANSFVFAPSGGGQFYAFLFVPRIFAFFNTDTKPTNTQTQSLSTTTTSNNCMLLLTELWNIFSHFHTSVYQINIYSISHICTN